MDELTEALSLAADSGRLVFLSGEAGIGKTRCADELAARAAAAGSLVLSSSTQMGESAPYWPWMQVLHDLQQAAESREDLRAPLAAHAAIAGQIAPELLQLAAETPRASALPPEQARFVLFDNVTRLLVEVSQVQPLMIVFDDLHWASEATLLMLEFFVRRLGQARILVLGLYREEEASVPALSRLLGQLGASEQCRCLSLRGLAEEEVRELVAGRLCIEAAERLAPSLWQQTKGNPFFVSELTLMVCLSGQPDSIGPAELARLAPSPNLRAVLRSRLAGLTPDCRHLLEVAAVLGTPFSIAILARAAGVTREHVLNLLAEASTSAFVLQSEAPDRFAFSHPLVEHVLYVQLSPISRTRLHGMVAEAIENAYVGPSAPLATLAHHFYRGAAAGYEHKAIEYALLAGRQAMSENAFLEAARSLGHGLELLETAELRDSTRHEYVVDLQEALGDALAATAAVGQADAAYETALSGCENDQSRRCTILTKRANIATGQRDLAKALQFIQAAESELGEQPDDDDLEAWWRAWVESEVKRMILYFYLGMVEEFDERYGPKLRDLEAHADPAQRAEYLGWRVLREQRRDGYVPSPETVALAREQYEAAVASGSLARRALGSVILGNTLAIARHFSEAAPLVEESASLSEKVGDVGQLLIALGTRCMLDRLSGDVEAVMKSARRCIQAAKGIQGWGELVAYSEANLAWLAWRESRLEECRLKAQAALDTWWKTPEFAYRGLADWPLLGCCLADGHIQAAIDLARDILHPSQQKMPPAIESHLLTAIDAEGTEASRILEQAVQLARRYSYT